MKKKKKAQRAAKRAKRVSKKRAKHSAKASSTTRVTVTLDRDVLKWFKGHVNAAGVGDFDDAINQVLRGFIDSQQKALDRAVRRIVREELRQFSRS